MPFVGLHAKKHSFVPLRRVIIIALNDDSDLAVLSTRHSQHHGHAQSSAGTDNGPTLMMEIMHGVQISGSAEGVRRGLRAASIKLRSAPQRPSSQSQAGSLRFMRLLHCSSLLFGLCSSLTFFKR